VAAAYCNDHTREGNNTQIIIRKRRFETILRRDIQRFIYRPLGYPFLTLINSIKFNVLNSRLLSFFCQTRYNGRMEFFGIEVRTLKHSLYKSDKEVYIEIQQPILSTFNTITASRYATNRHLEQISKEAIQTIDHIKNDPWQYYLIYLNGVYKRSIRLTNYLEFERRFEYFYRSMTEEIKRNVATLESNTYRLFLKKLLKLMTNDAEDEQAPWSNLLFSLFPVLPTAQIDYVYQTLTTNVDTEKCSHSLALAYSYVALLSGKELTALSVLQKNPVTTLEKDVLLHFELLQHRERWRTMKQWLAVLFPKKKAGQYGSLQKFVDEMNTVIPISTKEQNSIWNRWLLSPNYQRFLTYSKHLTSSQQNELIERLLPELELRLHQTEAAKTYEKILLAYGKFELAASYFLKYERDPTRLRDEKQELLTALKKHRPDLARPIYHQFIVRLVEKKSRIHYEQAASYIKELKSLYQNEKDQAIFAIYLSKLKKMYRTYRAFVEELKRIDL